MTHNDLDQYQQEATETAIYPGQGTPLGLVYVALKGAGEAGEFAEHVGKALRDDNLIEADPTRPTSPGWCNELTRHRKELLIKEIGDQLWYLAAKCNELDVNLSDVAAINLRKLRDRQSRGVLGGSGDER